MICNICIVSLSVWFYMTFKLSGSIYGNFSTVTPCNIYFITRHLHVIQYMYAKHVLFLFWHCCLKHFITEELLFSIIFKTLFCIWKPLTKENVLYWFLKLLLCEATKSFLETKLVTELVSWMSLIFIKKEQRPGFHENLLRYWLEYCNDKFLIIRIYCIHNWFYLEIPMW